MFLKTETSKALHKVYTTEGDPLYGGVTSDRSTTAPPTRMENWQTCLGRRMAYDQKKVTDIRTASLRAAGISISRKVHQLFEFSWICH